MTIPPSSGDGDELMPLAGQHTEVRNVESPLPDLTLECFPHLIREIFLGNFRPTQSYPVNNLS